MAVEIVERVYAPGDDCGGCGDALEPGDLAVWVEGYGRVHEYCSEQLEGTVEMTDTYDPAAPA